MLIVDAKSVDEKITGIEALEHWQKLKVYKISLAQYLEKEKIELLCQEIELSIGI